MPRRTRVAAAPPGERQGEGPAHRPAELRAYSFVGDGERGALLGPYGDIAWCCFPTFADDALFAGILGSGGTFAFDLGEACVPSGWYEEGTLIWHGRFVTQRGALETRDMMAYPGELHRALLLRSFAALSAPMDVEFVLEPARDFGRAPLGRFTRNGPVWQVGDGTVVARLHGVEDAKVCSGMAARSALRWRVRLEPGRSCELALELTSEKADAAPAVFEDLWRPSEAAWHAAVPPCEGVLARRDVRRSIAVIRALTAPNGGMVAAATTSLPEHDRLERNYDYRYCWIRDSCYVGHAGAALAGGEPLLDGAIAWVAERVLEDGKHLHPAYRADGGSVPGEHKLELPGYPGGHDVTGNRASSQLQLDAFGEALLLFAEGAERDRLDAAHWRAAEVCVDALEARGDEPDAGVWETAPQHWTHSLLAAVAGLRAICGQFAPASMLARALPLADRLMARASATGLHDSGRWQRAPGDGRIDAALLLGEIRGACAPDDTRSRVTRDAVRGGLVLDDYVFRYEHSAHRLGETEGALLICNHWLALALYGAGEQTAAVRYFERARAACGTSGLYAEEFDVETRSLRGNLPQAFVHGLLVEAAAKLSSALE